MTIQDIGSLGEMIAAIATVATLAYLAMQIRASSTLMRAESHRAVTDKASQVGLALAHDHQLADVFQRGLRNYGSLDPGEQVQFTFLLSEWLSAADLAFSEYRAGIVDRRAVDKVVHGVRGIFASPGGSEFWRIHQERLSLSPDFLTFFESEVRPKSQDASRS